MRCWAGNPQSATQIANKVSKGKSQVNCNQMITMISYDKILGCDSWRWVLPVLVKGLIFNIFFYCLLPPGSTFGSTCPPVFDLAPHLFDWLFPFFPLVPPFCLALKFHLFALTFSNPAFGSFSIHRVVKNWNRWIQKVDLKWKQWRIF